MKQIFDLDKLELSYLATATVSPEGVLLDFSSNWSIFGYKKLRRGERVDRIFEMLFAIFPMKEKNLILPYVSVPNGKYVDLELRRVDGVIFLIAMDVTEKADYVQKYQQVCNELEILKRESGYPLH